MRREVPPGVAEKKRAKADKLAVLTGSVPEWSSATAIAQMLGKSVRRIQQITQEGIIETAVPPGGGARKYRTCETIQKYLAYVEQRAQENADGGHVAELNVKKLEAEVALKESQGQLHQLKTAIQMGQYLDAREASEQLTEFMGKFKSFALAIPNRVGGVVSTYTDAATARAIEKATRREIEDMLALFVEAAVLGATVEAAE